MWIVPSAFAVGVVVKPTVCGACGWSIAEDTLNGAWQDEKGSDWCGAGFPHYPTLSGAVKNRNGGG